MSAAQPPGSQGLSPSIRASDNIASGDVNVLQNENGTDPLMDGARAPQSQEEQEPPSDLKDEHDFESDNNDDDDDDDDSINESLLGDLMAQDPTDIETLRQESVSPSKVCTPEEALHYRKRLHEIGFDKFVEETVTAGTISAKKLCTAFGVAPPQFLDGQPDTAYYRILGLALVREYTTRQKLDQYNTIDDVVELLKKSENVVVITGAGISTNLGIPDFRSKDTGFYAKMREKGFESGEDVFDIVLFRDDPTIFYYNCADTLPMEGVTSPTHGFIRLIQDKQKLLTNYTQNIDNIEGNAGILPQNLIQCHGSWATATCQKCGSKVPGNAIMADVRAKVVPECKDCKRILAAAPPLKRKRSSNSSRRSKNRYSDDDDDDDEAYNIPQPGIMKPDITFFGEQLPNHFFDRFRSDMPRMDLVIVIGTSMKVAPVSEIPSAVPATVPHVYISRDPCYHLNFDVTLLGDCDVIVGELARRVGWELKHSMMPETPREVDIAPWRDRKCVWTIKTKSHGPTEFDSNPVILQKTTITPPT